MVQGIPFGNRSRLAFFLATLGLAAASPGAQGVTVDTVQFSGPSRNRVDMVFFGDGWTQPEASAMRTELQSHIATFFQVPDYARYRKFFNVYLCNHFRVKPAGSLQTRANIQYYVDAILKAVPAAEPKYIVSHRGNSGEGGNVGLPDARLSLTSDELQDLIGAHELGHGWHRLGDTYAGGGAEAWPNSTADATGKKWGYWKGYTEPYLHLPVAAFKIPASGFYRPLNTTCTMMADVHCGRPTVHDPIGREKMVWDIYDLVDPLDSWTPDAATLLNPGEIKVAVVDPAVIKVDWFLDNRLVVRDGGGTFNPFPHINKPGEYTVRAHAYDFVVRMAYSDRGGDSLGVPGSRPSDSLDWVRRRLDKLQQDVTWKVAITSTASLSGRGVSGFAPRVLRADDRQIEVHFPGGGRYSVEALALDGTALGGTLSGSAGNRVVRMPWPGKRHAGLRILRIRHGGRTLVFKWAAPKPGL